MTAGKLPIRFTLPDPEPVAIGTFDAWRARDIDTPEGTLDRRVVAARVFRDHGALQRLNALVHPRIADRLLAHAEGLRQRGFRGVGLVDAALMLDWGFERHCDFVIAVVAPPLLTLLIFNSWELWHHRGTPLLGTVAANFGILVGLLAVFSRFVRNWDVPIVIGFALAAYYFYQQLANSA